MNRNDTQYVFERTAKVITNQSLDTSHSTNSSAMTIQ